MSTPATLKIYRNGHFLINIYKHWDGMPDVFGQEIKEFLKAKQWVNGIPVGKERTVFNGIDDWIAQFIKKIKKQAGDVYITEETEEGEYNYIIDVKKVMRKDKKIVVIKLKCLEDRSIREKIKYEY